MDIATINESWGSGDKMKLKDLQGKFRSNPECFCEKCRAKRQFNKALKVLINLERKGGKE